MKIEHRKGGWFIFPETQVDKIASGLSSTSGPWNNEEAAKLASQGRIAAAHAAHNKISNKRDEFR